MSQYQGKDRFREGVFALVKQNRLEEAYQLCTEQIEFMPIEERHLAYGHRAYISRQAGRLREAYNDLTLAITSEPSWAGHVYQRTRLALELEDPASAIEDASRLIEIERGRQSGAFLNEAFLLRALAYMMLNEPERSLADLRMVTGAAEIRIRGKFWCANDIEQLTAKGALK